MMIISIVLLSHQGSGKPDDQVPDKSRERVLEREREQERNPHVRSSTTHALAGTSSGRLREPIGAAAPSPIGKSFV